MGRLFALLLLALPVFRAFGQKDPATWHVLIEPTFMHPEVSFPIPDATRTVLVPGYMGDDGDPVYFTKKDWDALGLRWDAFRARAAGNATEKKVSGQLVRDHNKVVQYAVFGSRSPLTATMVLDPGFLAKFQTIFGSTILVAIPDRYTVYVFPRLASDYKDYSGLILGEYHDSTYPVSTEVFEISSAGLRAIGLFDDD